MEQGFSNFLEWLGDKHPPLDQITTKLLADYQRARLKKVATRGRKNVRDVFELMEALGHTQLPPPRVIWRWRCRMDLN